MGVVYRAEQDNPRREVALKAMRLNLSSQEAMRRFELEAAILGRLKHPGIAQIHEAGMHDDGTGPRPYFAMELVDGPPLMAFADRERLPTRGRLELFAKICEAVNYAHQKGVVHRDLKPANILVVSESPDEPSNPGATGPPRETSKIRGFPKILDFGVARATDSDLQATTMHTQTGQVVGTLPYMSPEQIVGEVGEIDTRSDVYALGVIAYELLAGQPPFEVANKSIAAAARTISEEEPPPLTKFDRAYGGDLNTIVLKALEKDPGRRYQSASDLAADVQRYLEHRPISARPGSTIYQLRKFARRNKAAVIGAAAVLGVLIGGLVSTSYGLAQAVRAREAEAEHRTLAEKSEGAAIAARDEAQAVTYFLIDMLRAIEPQARGADVSVREVLDRAETTVGEKFVGRPLVEARVRYAMAVSYAGLDLFDKAQTHMAEAAALFQRQKGERDRETLMALTALTLIFSERGESSKGEAQARATLEVQRRVLGEEDAHTLLTMANLARAVRDQGRYSEAETLIRKALEVQNRRLGEEHSETLESMNMLGTIMFFQGRYAESEAQHRKTLEIRRRVRGEDHAITLGSMHNLANAVNAQGRFPEAEELHRRALAGRRRVMGEEHVNTLMSIDDLARNLRDQDRFAEAEELSRKALVGFRRALGDEHPDTLEAMQNLAVAIQQQGRFEESDELLTTALDAANRTLGAEHPMTLAALQHLAALRLAMNKLEEAERYARQCLESRRRVQGKLHPETAAAMHLLARICVGLGKYDDAENLGRRVHEILTRTHGPDAIATREVAETLRDLYQKLGRTEDAAEWNPRAGGSSDVASP